MKIGLHVESPSDAEFFEALLLRVLGVSPRDIVILSRRGQCIQGLSARLASTLDEFRRLACTHVVLGADQHDAGPAEAARLAREALAMAAPLPCAIGVPQRSLEAWLLADYRTVASVLEQLPFDPPPRVEQIQDPKRYLTSRVGTPNKFQLAGIARQMDLGLARRNSPSLDRFLRSIEEWRQ